MKHIRPFAMATVLSLPMIASAQFTLPTGVDLRIYGVADIMLQHYRVETATGTATRTLVEPGGLGTSRLGFFASKDLDGGYKAVARFEAGLNLDTGRLASTGGSADRIFGRQAYVGLQGSFGEIRGGRVQGPGYNYVLDFDPAYLGPTGSFGALLTQKSANPGVPSAPGTASNGFLINPIVRTDNTIMYLSPNLNGLTFQIARTPSESVAGVGEQSAAYARYENSGWYFGYAVQSVGESRASPTFASASVLEQAVGMGKKFGRTDLAVSLHQRNHTNPTLATNGSINTPQAEKALILSGSTGVSSVGDILYTIGRYYGPKVNTDASSAALVYRHYLEKTTAVFIGTAYLSQQSASAIGLGVPTIPSPKVGGSATALMTGLNFRF